MTVLQVFDVDGSVWELVPTDEPQVDTAVTAYIESAGMRDAVLHLTGIDGAVIRLLASRVGAWKVEGTDHRRNQAMLEIEARDERAAIASELGVWIDGDEG